MLKTGKQDQQIIRKGRMNENKIRKPKHFVNSHVSNLSIAAMILTVGLLYHPAVIAAGSDTVFLNRHPEVLPAMDLPLSTWVGPGDVLRSGDQICVTLRTPKDMLEITSMLVSTLVATGTFIVTILVLVK